MWCEDGRGAPNLGHAGAAACAEVCAEGGFSGCREQQRNKMHVRGRSSRRHACAYRDMCVGRRVARRTCARAFLRTRPPSSAPVFVIVALGLACGGRGRGVRGAAE